MVGRFNFTGGDIRRDGRVTLLHTRGRIFRPARVQGEPVASALAKDPLRMPNSLEIQGESIPSRQGFQDTPASVKACNHPCDSLNKRPEMTWSPCLNPLQIMD